MKGRYTGSVGTLAMLIDGLVLALFVIAFFWYAGRATLASDPGHSSERIKVVVQPAPSTR